MPSGRTASQRKSPSIDADQFTSKQRNVRVPEVTHAAAYAAQRCDDLIKYNGADTNAITLPQSPVEGQVCEMWEVANGAAALTVTAGADAYNIFGPGKAAAASYTVASAYAMSRFTFVGPTTLGGTARGWQVTTKTDAV